MQQQSFPRTATAAAALSCALSMFTPSGIALAAEPVRTEGTNQPQAPGAPAPRQIDRVEINGKASLDDPDAAAAKRIVTRAELDVIASTNLLDAMRRIPGVAVISNGRTPQIALGGLGGGYTTILVDGAPPPPGFNLETIGTAQIERIEISRVATAEQSGRAISGVLNIVMRQARTGKLNELKTVVSGSGENGDNSASLVRNDSAGTLTHVLSAQLRHFYFDNTIYRTRLTETSDGVSVQELENFDHVGSSSGSLSGRANWKSSDTSTLQFDYGGVFRRTDYDSREIDPTTSGISRNTAPHSLDRSLRGKVQYNAKLASGATYDLRASLGRGGQNERRTFEPVDQAPTRLEVDRTDRTALLGGTWRMPTDLIGRISAGVEWERTNRRDTSRTGPVDALQDDTDGRVRATRGSGFVQSDVELNPRMPAYFGVRFERVSLDSRFTQDGSLSQAERASSQWSPVVQVKYRFLENGPGPVLRAAIRRAYKIPSPDELSLRRRLATVNSALSPDEKGNVDLHPESADIFELGFEGPLQKWGTASLNLSHKEIRDVIQRVLLLDGTRWTYAPRNLGRATADGADIELKASLQKLSAALPKVDVRAGYGIYRSRIKSLPFGDNSLLQQLPWNTNVAVDWQIASLPVMVSLAYSKFGGKLVRLDESRLIGSPSIENIELSAAYTSASWGVFRMGLTNASAPTIRSSDYFLGSDATISQASHYRRPAGIKGSWDMKF
jgi:outer membrane receptor for ferrienterochelin and colicins